MRRLMLSVVSLVLAPVACACVTHIASPTQSNLPPAHEVRREPLPPPLEFGHTVELPEADDVPIHIACKPGMVEVEGDFCPQVEEVCLRWVDAHGNTLTGRQDPETGRCGEFQKPTRCLAPKTHMHYCIDKYEAGGAPGETPPSWVSYYDAEKILSDRGERVCTQSEWTFACEGEDIQPYPYGDGYERDRTACNFDNPKPTDIDVFQAKRPGDTMSQKLDALLRPSGSEPRCVSPFGVHQQVGNLDEWVLNQGPGWKSGLMGGHVWGVRSRCRPVTNGHGPTFSWYETTFRGCSDIRSSTTT